MLRGVVFAFVVGVCALSGCSPSPQGNPDPGQRILHALAPVLAAIPATAAVAYRHLNAPRWDSCDGRASTYGWDDVSVDSTFTSRDPDAVVFQAIDDRLTRQGWHLVSGTSSLPSGDGSWSRVLGNGETARATLNGPGDGGGGWWSLYAAAPPAVHPVSGC